MYRIAKARQWHIGTGLIVVIVLIVAGYLYWTLSRPLASLQPSSSSALSAPLTATTSSLVWPAVGQAAVGVTGTSILDSHGAMMPVPIASAAKLLTALSVLKQKPLAVGQPGPTITLGASDVALYNAYLAEDGSVVKVVAGEQLSEYQMLEAMLLPSANNMADSLAIWAFGSLPAYSSFANSYAASLGLTHTHIGPDASGFNPSTTSTADDLVKLGEASMQDPVLAAVVNQATVNGFPVVGSIKNVNYLLGKNNIIGIKTGNSDQAGGVYLSASKITVNQQPVTIVTSLLNAPTLVVALDDSVPMITSAQANFKTVKLLKAGSTVGLYRLPWGGSDTVTATQDLQATVWGGGQVAVRTQLNAIKADSPSGSDVGSLIVRTPSFGPKPTALVSLSQTPTKPSLWWRLIHPNF